MVVRVGQPFPEKDKEYLFTGKSGAVFTADVYFVDIIGWSTKGVVGVEVNITMIIKDVKKSSKPTLKLVENPVG